MKTLVPELDSLTRDRYICFNTNYSDNDRIARMNSLDYLRNEITSYYPEASELQLSTAFAGQRRFNFYFKIAPQQRFLLYLNWDGDGDGYTLKCLEFQNAETLSSLMAEYPEKGLKVFNVGQPLVAVSFVYQSDVSLIVTDYRGDARPESREITGRQLMFLVNPFE